MTKTNQAAPTSSAAILSAAQELADELRKGIACGDLTEEGARDMLAMSESLLSDAVELEGLS